MVTSPSRSICGSGAATAKAGSTRATRSQTRPWAGWHRVGWRRRRWRRSPRATVASPFRHVLDGPARRRSVADELEHLGAPGKRCRSQRHQGRRQQDLAHRALPPGHGLATPRALLPPLRAPTRAAGSLPLLPTRRERGLAMVSAGPPGRWARPARVSPDVLRMQAELRGEEALQDEAASGGAGRPRAACAAASAPAGQSARSRAGFGIRLSKSSQTRRSRRQS